MTTKPNSIIKVIAVSRDFCSCLNALSKLLLSVICLISCTSICRAQDSINVALMTGATTPDYESDRYVFQVGTLYKNGTFVVNPSWGMTWFVATSSPWVNNFSIGHYYLPSEIGINELPSLKTLYQGNFSFRLALADSNPDYNRYEVILGGGGNSTLNITLGKPASWSLSHGKLQIKTGAISNPNSGGTSGSLRLQVWASKRKYAGGQISGYILGTLPLGQLNGGYYFPKVSGKVAFKKPPKGTYYTMIAVVEYSTNKWLIDNYINVSKRSKF